MAIILDVWVNIMHSIFGMSFDDVFKDGDVFTDDLDKSSLTSNPTVIAEIDLVWVLSGRSTVLHNDADKLKREFDSSDDLARVLEGVRIAKEVNALRTGKKVEELQVEDYLIPILYNGRTIHNQDLLKALDLGIINYPKNMFIILPVVPESTIGQVNGFKDHVLRNAHQNVAVVSSAYHIPRVSRTIGNDSPQTDSEFLSDHPIRRINFFLFGVHKNEKRTGIIEDLRDEAQAMAKYSSSNPSSIARTQSRNTFLNNSDFVIQKSFRNARYTIHTKEIYHFAIKGFSLPCTIKLINNPNEIDKEASCEILVKSFMDEYRKYLTPAQIDTSLTSWTGGSKSVEAYYKKYFQDELHHFQSGNLDFWIEAKIGSKLVGWATFEWEKSKDPLKLDSLYMNLLIVHPDFQRLSIGTQLVQSMMRMGIIQDLDAIHLLLRKRNMAGRAFYTELGFKPNPNYHRDNYVDLSLLEALTWDNPVLQEGDVDNFHIEYTIAGRAF